MEPFTSSSAGGFFDIGIREPAPVILYTLEEHAGSVKSVAFSPDGRTLVSAGGDGSPSARHLPPVFSILAFGPENGSVTVHLWDAATGALRYTLEEHTGSVKSVAFSPAGHILASAGWDDTVRLWNMAAHDPPGTRED